MKTQTCGNCGIVGKQRKMLCRGTRNRQGSGWYCNEECLNEYMENNVDINIEYYEEK